MTTENAKSSNYKKILNVIAKAAILAFILTICIVPMTVKARKADHLNNSAKPSRQIEKDLSDPELDTLTVTNKNIGNFKKGFFGDSAIAAVSGNPFYKLDVVARVGTLGLTNISSGSTINSSGQTAFAGRTAAGFAFYAGDTQNVPRVISPPASSP